MTLDTGVSYANIARRDDWRQLACKYSDLPLSAVDASVTAVAQHLV